MSTTGIGDPASIGIVGDAAHAASGGYHEGKTDLKDAGVFGTDYSTRLTRDRNGCTESASAMDVGYQWPKGGNAAWLRFNNMFASYLHANDARLAAVRAINYTTDGTHKYRTDRESGWSVVSSTDTVDVHTHIEWYRDTEGNRSASLTFINAMAQAAVAGHTTVGAPMADSDIPGTYHSALNADAFGLGTYTGQNINYYPGNSTTNPQPYPNVLHQKLDAIKAKTDTITAQTAQLTDAQVTAIANQVATSQAAQLTALSAKLDLVVDKFNAMAQAILNTTS
jgi:hypothetical protein